MGCGWLPRTSLSRGGAEWCGSTGAAGLLRACEWQRRYRSVYCLSPVGFGVWRFVVTARPAPALPGPVPTERHDYGRIAAREDVARDDYERSRRVTMSLGMPPRWCL